MNLLFHRHSQGLFLSNPGSNAGSLQKVFFELEKGLPNAKLLACPMSYRQVCETVFTTQ